MVPGSSATSARMATAVTPVSTSCSTGSRSGPSCTTEARNAAVLDQYGFGPYSWLEIFSISENATYRVSDPDSGRVVVLRLSRPGERSRAEILSEIA